MAFHWVDWVIVALIGLSMLTGLFRGFVKELIALCVWVIGFWLAFHYMYVVDAWYAPYLQDKTIRIAVSFVSILVATIIVGGIINATLGFIMRRSGLSGTDRLLGMLFGVVRGIFIVSLLMLVIKMTSIPFEEYSQKALLYEKFSPLVNWMYGYMPDVMKHMNESNKNTHESDLHMSTEDIIHK